MLTARDIMTTDVVTVPEDATLRELAELLAARDIVGVAVLRGDQVVGVVSAADLAAFPPAAPGAAHDAPAFFREVSARSARAAAAALLAEDDARRALARHVASEAMARTLHALPPGATVDDVAAAMERADAHRLLVTVGDRLLGMVTMAGLVRAACAATSASAPPASAR